MEHIFKEIANDEDFDKDVRDIFKNTVEEI